MTEVKLLVVLGIPDENVLGLSTKQVLTTAVDMVTEALASAELNASVDPVEIVEEP